MNKLSLGGLQALPIKPEAWSETGCGSTGSVQVQCTKIKGKLHIYLKDNSTSPYSRATKENQGAFFYPT